MSCLLFTLVEFATSLGEQVAPDFTDQLRGHLLRAEGGRTRCGRQRSLMPMWGRLLI
jgi:hypothetical protein